MPYLTTTVPSAEVKMPATPHAPMSRRPSVHPLVHVRDSFLATTATNDAAVETTVNKNLNGAPSACTPLRRDLSRVGITTTTTTQTRTQSLGSHHFGNAPNMCSANGSYWSHRSHNYGYGTILRNNGGGGGSGHIAGTVLPYPCSATAASGITSFRSNELQEYASLASPTSDFYAYSPQTCQLDAVVPASQMATAAELYGGFSGGGCYYGGSGGGGAYGSFSSGAMGTAAMTYYGTMEPPMPRCNSPSYMSSNSCLSMSGSHFPQWYLPRSVYGTQNASPVVYGYGGVPATEAERDAGEEGEGEQQGMATTYQMPSTPRLYPSCYPSAVYPLTLPPPMYEGEMLPQMALALSPPPPRPTPFVAYDGRAYALPGTCTAPPTQGLILTPPSSPRTAERLLSQSVEPAVQMESAKKVTSPNGGYSAGEAALLEDAHARLSRVKGRLPSESREVARVATASISSLPPPPTTTTTAAAVQGREGTDGAESEPSMMSSIRRGSDEGDTVQLDASMLEELQVPDPLQEEEEAGELADPRETDSVLEKVLAVPGVRWRHDPYSRRVLVTPPSSLSTAGDGGTMSPTLDSGEEGKGAARYVMPSSHLSSGSGPASLPGTPPPLATRAAALKQSQLEDSACSTQAPVSKHRHALPSVHQPYAHGERADRYDCEDCHSNTNSSHSISGISPEEEETVAAAPGRQRQPSVRRVPIKTVCVRHYIDAMDGTYHSSVGQLVTVISSRGSSGKAPPRAPLGRSGTSSDEAPPLPKVEGRETKKAARLNATAAADAMSVAPPPREEFSTLTVSSSNTSMYCPLALRGRGGQSRCVPPRPRSKQYNPASTTSGALIAITDRRYPSPRPGPAITRSAMRTSVAREGPWRSADKLNKNNNNSTDGGNNGASWAWRARAALRPKLFASTEGSESTALVKVTGPCEESALTAFPAAFPQEPQSAADLDTRSLQQLWQRLESSACFSDAFKTRLQALGPHSNSSSRCLGRPAARRMAYHWGSHSSTGSRVLAAATARVTEEAVTHVHVLHHACRDSYAVSDTAYPCGAEVVVDGDMGIETGVITATFSKKEYAKMSIGERRAEKLPPNLYHALAFCIHRVLRPNEKELQRTVQRPLEEATLNFVRYLATQPQLFRDCRIEEMEFLGVEFQADGQKLYVHYQVSYDVRFLELATYLNHVFHCRVWMRMNKCLLNDE